MTDKNLLKNLKFFKKNRNRNEYYRCIRDAGDKYGELALGVVEQSEFSGRVAKRFAECIACQNNVSITSSLWKEISEGLMDEDYEARLDQTRSDNPLFLPWYVVRSYHESVFRSHSIPARAWTAYIPRELAGEALL